LGTLRARRELLEVRASDLRFGRAEADALLNGTLGLELDAREVELLRARTEGWPAGLQLAALSLRGHEDKRAFVDAFAGDDRQIGDYLHELLLDLSPPMRQFLLSTSVLERMCVSLCDAMIDGGEAGARLAEAERANLFLVALDNRREWYRYHHLFRDLLRRELGRTAPRLVAELHRRAHAWHVARGYTEEAIAYATAAGDVAAACELIAQHWLPLFNKGELGTLARWIDALPREAVLADARVCPARGWVALFLGRYTDVETWLRCANVAGNAPTHDGLGRVEANPALLQASLATLSGDVSTARAAARRELAEYQDPLAPGRAIAHLNLGQAQYYTDGATDAATSFSVVLRALSGNEWAAAIITALGYLAAVHFDAGDIASAEQRAAQAEGMIDACRVHEAPFTSPTLLARARLLELGGDLAAAERAFDRAVTLARRGDWRPRTACSPPRGSSADAETTPRRARWRARHGRCSRGVPIPVCSTSGYQRRNGPCSSHSRGAAPRPRRMIRS
jgi:LuxR family maltose regulon positive regulatory protein